MATWLRSGLKQECACVVHLWHVYVYSVMSTHIQTIHCVMCWHVQCTCAGVCVGMCMYVMYSEGWGESVDRLSSAPASAPVYLGADAPGQ